MVSKKEKNAVTVWPQGGDKPKLTEKAAVTFITRTNNIGANKCGLIRL